MAEQKKKEVGVLGIYTTALSKEAQEKIKPIRDEIMALIYSKTLTKHEAHYLGFCVYNEIGDNIREAEKYEQFLPIQKLRKE